MEVQSKNLIQLDLLIRIVVAVADVGGLLFFTAKRLAECNSIAC